ncbi:MAG: hypothetical protein F6K25_28420 [Okeania sp. SIO2G4]|uniref:hypothetical protein n=1 Tax=unclassified Okeania TaxID=2634635 RepID=UPI0013B7820F|nr:MULTISPECIES: hypothetical protein [unclassified Okeania]NEP41150.1 hypothetical protein [Okeania sp. SIO2H7]NEP75517.1 hypothetical protein [Okeania sp. SIO2G5]NEP96638.1 hypothetical protein [Okeania sp. SIO2F5]NEQ94364.1 hypothetical protein [Okeania sp. SIO2G4]
MLRIISATKRFCRKCPFDKAVVSVASRRVGWRSSERLCQERVPSPSLDQESGATPRRCQSHLVAHQDKKRIYDLKTGIEAIPIRLLTPKK